MKNLLNIVALSAFTLLAGSACAQTGTMNRAKPSKSMSGSAKSTGADLAGSLISAADFSTLKTAMVAAGLVDKAKEAGPFTVFAPSNAAFDKLPAGTVETLVKPENKATLQGILAYHVVAGNVMAADLKDGQKIKTVGGGTLTVSKKGGSVMLMDAKGGSATVTTADIQATNGTVHAIDSVLMPN